MQDPYIAYNYTVEVIHPSPIENDNKIKALDIFDKYLQL